jgi:CheY-like chemotaxis protein
MVLLVDDSDDCRLVYAEYLTSRGFRVEHAVDGEHALFKVAALQPDVVVMDLSLPTLDGWAATERLKSHPKTRHIPIVVLTGIVLPEPLERARRAGADHVESKPCAPDTLLTLLERLLPPSA